MPRKDRPIYDRQTGEQRRETGRALLFMTQLGINLVLCVAIGIAAGYWLDRWLGTSPWLLLIFTFLGMGAAFKSIFDLGMKK